MTTAIFPVRRASEELLDNLKLGTALLQHLRSCLVGNANVIAERGKLPGLQQNRGDRDEIKEKNG